MIAELLNGWGKVNLFTRPRRFGKTLNMSMLKYPVVFVSLKGVDGITFEDAYELLRFIIRDEFLRLDFLSESSSLTDAEKIPFRNILYNRENLTELKNSLKMLCSLLEKSYGKKVILLIDEYDVPLDKAYAHGYYDQMIDLIRAMFGAALKTNDSLFMAVLTGCFRVSKESIFTGLNNLMVHSISEVSYDEYFGFTDAEVRTLLADYGLKMHYEEARDWYDGYRVKEIRQYGIAFWEKECRVVVKNWMNIKQ